MLAGVLHSLGLLQDMLRSLGVSRHSALLEVAGANMHW